MKGANGYAARAFFNVSARRKQWTARDSDSWIEGSGIVIRVLTDDDDSSPHQRFVVDARNGQTLLVAHNLELSTRVPLGLGDRIRFRGIYEWNALGGLIHWTHHDPMGVEKGGYIEHRRQTYR